MSMVEYRRGDESSDEGEEFPPSKPSAPLPDPNLEENGSDKKKLKRKGSRLVPSDPIKRARIEENPNVSGGVLPQNPNLPLIVVDHVVDDDDPEEELRGAQHFENALIDLADRLNQLDVNQLSPDEGIVRDEPNGPDRLAAPLNREALVRMLMNALQGWALARALERHVQGMFNDPGYQSNDDSDSNEN